MERDSAVYKLRRKCQVLAYRLTSPEFVSKIYFRLIMGYKLNLKHPKTLNEKLQWLKLNKWPYDKKAIQCADKYAVRQFIKDKQRSEILNDILYVWEDADEIVWDELPNEFVLKCNHGCGYNIICKNKKELDEKETRDKLRSWMNEDFSEFNAEPHYGKIKRRIICEKYLGDNVINYNLYCFNGNVVFFSVAGGLGDGVGEHLTYYMRDGSMAKFKNKSYPAKKEKLSALLPQMIETAEYLSSDFPMVRVDLFDINNKIILSEMTFTPGGGLIPFDPVEADLMLGEKLDISELTE